MKGLSKVRSWFHTRMCPNIASGSGKLLYTGDSRLILDKSAKIYLKGSLELNKNAMGRNGRTSILRMDRDSVLKVEGNFSFMYGADVILFPGASLTLKDGSFINSDCKIRCTKSIEIGEDCAISHDVTIMDSDVHYLDGDNHTCPVKIGNHVWIGTRVTILSGVTVGNGAVIAAGSLVNSDVPERCLVAGVPARVIRREVEWTR